MNKKSRLLPTLGLAMIMKDEINDLDRIIGNYGHLFDKIYITVTDKKTYATLSRKVAKESKFYQKVELSYFEWIDHFGKARIYNQEQIDTDYWMWIDTDDEIKGAGNIQSALTHMAENNLDVVWFEYDYIRRVNLSDPEAVSRRERIVRTASGIMWRDEAIHETLNIPGMSRQDFLSDVRIEHRKTTDQSHASGERNRLILEKDWEEHHRPMTAYYLGSYYGEKGEYGAAIEKLLFTVNHGESSAVKFAAWLNLCICYCQTSQYESAIHAADECIAIDFDHPEPWYHKFTAYRAVGDHDRAMQSAEIFLGKPVPSGALTLINQDFSWYQYKGPLNIAHAYLTIGNSRRAYELYSAVKKIAPQYIQEVSAMTGMHLNDMFEHLDADVETRAT